MDSMAEMYSKNQAIKEKSKKWSEEHKLSMEKIMNEKHEIIKQECKNIFYEFGEVLQLLLGKLIYGDKSVAPPFAILKEIALDGYTDDDNLIHDENDITGPYINAKLNKMCQSLVLLDRAFEATSRQRAQDMPEVRAKKDWDLHYFMKIAEANNVRQEVSPLIFIAARYLEEGNIFQPDSWKVKAI